MQKLQKLTKSRIHKVTGAHRRHRAAVLLGTLGVLGLVACGGKSPGAKGPGGSGGTGENADGTVSVGGGQATQVPKRTVSKNAKADFKKAAAFHKQKAKEGWNKDTCNAVARKWSSVAGEHGKLVEARYNAGLAYHQCGMYAKAEAEYKKALRVVPRHAPSLSNLGELMFVRGDHNGAKTQWTRALEADSKLVAARNNLAWLLLEQLRKTKDRSTWKRIEKEARDQLSSVLAVDQTNTKAYVLYGLVYLEGSERNKNRLDLSKLLLNEAAKHDKNYAPLYNARGLLYLRRKSPGVALGKFSKAVELDPSFLEARMNVGNITLGFRKYKTAEEQFAAVLAKRPKDYDALIGQGIAERGLGKLDEAEGSYKAAMKANSKAADAYFNMGVLYKDFRANKAADLKGSVVMYKKAKGYFNQFLGKAGIAKADRAEAKANIRDCDKTIKQIENAIKVMKQANAPAAKPAK